MGLSHLPVDLGVKRGRSVSEPCLARDPPPIDSTSPDAVINIEY